MICGHQPAAERAGVYGAYRIQRRKISWKGLGRESKTANSISGAISHLHFWETGRIYIRCRHAIPRVYFSIFKRADIATQKLFKNRRRNRCRRGVPFVKQNEEPTSLRVIVTAPLSRLSRREGVTYLFPYSSRFRNFPRIDYEERRNLGSRDLQGAEDRDGRLGSRVCEAGRRAFSDAVGGEAPRDDLSSLSLSLNLNLFLASRERKGNGRRRERRVVRYSEITRDETFIKHTAHESFVDFQQSAPGSGRI